MTHRHHLSVIAILLLIIVNYCPVMADDLKVGILLPMSGSLAAVGKTHWQGFQFAQAEINDAGGIRHFGGKQLKLVLVDTKGSPTIGMQHTNALIADGVMGLIGAYQSTVTFATSEIAEQHHVPYLIPTALADGLTQRGFKYVFRPEATVSDFVRDQFQFLKDMAHLTNRSEWKIAILYEDTLFGQSAALAQKAYAKAVGWSVVSDMPYSAEGNQSLYAKIAMKLKRANPDVVLQSSYLQDSIQLARAFNNEGFRPLAIVATGAGPKDPAFIKALGRLSENWFVVNEFCQDMKKTQARDINAKFKRQFGVDFDGISAMSYVALWTLKEALEQSSTLKPEDIRTALADLNLNSGPTSITPLGYIHFDSNGQNQFKNLITQISNGHHHTVWPFELASRQPVWPAYPGSVHHAN